MRGAVGVYSTNCRPKSFLPHCGAAPQADSRRDNGGVLCKKGFVRYQPGKYLRRLHAYHLERNGGSVVRWASLGPIVDLLLGALRHAIENGPRRQSQWLHYGHIEPLGKGISPLMVEGDGWKQELDLVGETL